MAQNDFLVWAGGINANVLPQSAYTALGNLTSGVVTGRASGQQANKTWRQASVMSAMLAKFIVDRTGFDVIDDGTIQTIAGSGPTKKGYGGDGGPATQARFNYPNGIAVDSSGNAYVAGYTDSLNFPIRTGLFPSAPGQGDAFVSKLNPAAGCCHSI